MVYAKLWTLLKMYSWKLMYPQAPPFQISKYATGVYDIHLCCSYACLLCLCWLPLTRGWSSCLMIVTWGNWLLAAVGGIESASHQHQQAACSGSCAAVVMRWQCAPRQWTVDPLIRMAVDHVPSTTATFHHMQSSRRPFLNFFFYIYSRPGLVRHGTKKWTFVGHRSMTYALLLPTRGANALSLRRIPNCLGLGSGVVVGFWWFEIRQIEIWRNEKEPQMSEHLKISYLNFELSINWHCAP